jgi:hypothetical protein
MSPDRLRQQVPGGDYYIVSDGGAVCGVSSGGSTEMTQAWAPELKHARIDDNLLDYVETGLLRMKYVPATEAFRAYYDYREVGGIMFPHMWMRLFGERTPPHLFIVDEAAVNEECEESFFAVP